MPEIDWTARPEPAPRIEKPAIVPRQVAKRPATVPANREHRDHAAELLLAEALPFIHKFAVAKANSHKTDQGRECANLEARVRKYLEAT